MAPGKGYFASSFVHREQRHRAGRNASLVAAIVATGSVAAIVNCAPPTFLRMGPQSSRNARNKMCLPYHGSCQQWAQPVPIHQKTFCTLPLAGRLLTSIVGFATVLASRPHLRRGLALRKASTLPWLSGFPPQKEENQHDSCENAGDFFLFIKSYGWSLRYRLGFTLENELDIKKPLQLEWVKLRRPIENPDDLFNASSHDLFDWAMVEPPRHHGFMYHVTRAFDSGVEAVINFFEGHGLELLVQPDKGIQLKGRGPQSKDQDSTPEYEPRSITHCWVETGGLPFLPILQSIVFYNLHTEVLSLQA